MLVTLRSQRVKADRRQYISEKEITPHFTCTFISPFYNQEWSKRNLFLHCSYIFMQWGDKKERKTNLIITKFLELNPNKMCSRQ